MAGLLGRAHLWYCRQCRRCTSALTITGPTAFANGVNLELLRLPLTPKCALSVRSIARLLNSISLGFISCLPTRKRVFLQHNYPAKPVRAGQVARIEH